MNAVKHLAVPHSFLLGLGALGYAQGSPFRSHLGGITLPLLVL